MRQGPLAEALAAMRANGASEPFVSQQLETIFAAEAERVANASVLAELLRPMLTQQLASGTPASAAPLVDSTSPIPAGAPFVSAPPTAAATPAKPEVPRPGPMDIASFIDDMLAQERAEPAVRRVS